MIRFEGGNLKENVSTIESIFKENLPNSAFDYLFLNDYVAQLYANEARMSNIVLFFSIVAIMIACLGLFGLAAYTAEQRTKEIGVRKVLGASVSGIMGLLSISFLRLVLIAFVIAAPLAWYYLNQWLNGFTFRISMPWWSYFIAGIFTVLVALFTVSFQSLKAAMVNPVKSLKTE